MPSFRGIVNFARGNPATANAYFCNGKNDFATTSLFGLTSDLAVDAEQAKPVILEQCGPKYYLQFSVATTATNFQQAYFPQWAAGGADGAHGVLEWNDDLGKSYIHITDGWGVYDGVDLLTFCFVCEPPKGK